MMTLKAQDLAYLKLLLAIRQNDFNTLKAILSSHPQLLYYSSNGNGLLHQSIVLNNLKVLAYLQYLGANFNIKNHLGYTPLIQAILFDKVNTVRWLLSQGCDPNSQDIKGNTAYHHAVYNYNPKIIRLLQDYGANPNIPNYLGKLPKHYRIQSKTKVGGEDEEQPSYILKGLLGLIVAGLLLPPVISLLIVGFYMLYKVSMLFSTEHQSVSSVNKESYHKKAEGQYQNSPQAEEHIEHVWPHILPKSVHIKPKHR